MEEENRRDATPLRRNLVRSLHEIACSLNIASAIGYGALLYVYKNLMSMEPRSDVGYYFTRASVRIIDFLHLGAVNPVTTLAVARQDEGRWGQVGEFVSVLLAVFCATLVILLLLRAIASTRAYPAILRTFSGLIALFAVPTCLLVISRVFGHWETHEMPSPLSTPLWQRRLLAVFVAQLLCFGILLCVQMVRRIPSWVISAFLVLHYSVWGRVLWLEVPDWIHGPDALRLMVLAAPLSGFFWFLYIKHERLEADGDQIPRRTSKIIVAGAVALMVINLLIWIPSRADEFPRSKELESVSVEISRGPCFGRCPSYRVTIHGDGRVEYVGGRYVRVRGQQTAAITTEQMKRVLDELAYVHFFALEDRAFRWCFDAPSVGVSVSMDGRTKRVTSDSGCFGAKDGVQAQFVRAADEIDRIIGTDQWVKCDGYCR